QTLVPPSPETLLGQSIWEVLPESVGSTFYNEIQRAVAEQVTVSFETFWRRPGLWVEIHAYPSKDGLSIYQRDITERIRAKEELESERARLEAVLRQMPAGVVIAEAPSGKIILANEQMEHIWRQPFLRVNSIEKYREYLGFHPDGCLYEAAEWPLARSIAGGETVVGEEIAIKRGDGTRGVISVNSAPVTDSEGRTVAAVAVFQDITALKEVERLKGEFVSIASHELRTPVTSLKGYSQTIMRRRSRQLSDPESDLRALRAIEKQSDRLVHLIDELLEVSRLNVGQLELHRESVDLGHLAGQIIDHLSVTTEKHRLRLQCQRPVLVEADSGRVEQVLVNLLTNAIKYSPDGGDIDVAILPRESEVVISVRDRGIGIPRARQVQLFEPFYRAHRGAQQDFGGIGLGLYISRQIIERHGGDMWMHSEEGAGSTFHFTLPLVTRRLNKISPPQEDTLERSPLTS
ncbi:MAG: ATP-binding protein, partial [Chloroflexi bacterium]|nr:ATP-binding protein [Chloroflexota bacterium]